MILLLFLLFSQIKMVWIDSSPPPIKDNGKNIPTKLRLITWGSFALEIQHLQSARGVRIRRFWIDTETFKKNRSGFGFLIS